MAAQINWLNSTPCWGKAVAEQPDTSSTALMKLAAHADVGVRIAVADHPSTRSETVLLLAQDENADLRYAIAENHNIDVAVLNMLTEDDNPFVAQRAKKTLARLQAASIVPFPAVDINPSLFGRKR